MANSSADNSLALGNESRCTSCILLFVLVLHTSATCGCAYAVAVSAYRAVPHSETPITITPRAPFRQSPRTSIFQNGESFDDASIVVFIRAHETGRRVRKPLYWRTLQLLLTCRHVLKDRLVAFLYKNRAENIAKNHSGTICNRI